jgi:DNA helicase-2/ATP-dependent DNA helicase PcrA
MDHAFETKYAAARRAAIVRCFPSLNPEQLAGALATEGPLLLLAGAGSGKTTVLIHGSRTAPFRPRLGQRRVTPWGRKGTCARWKNTPRETAPRRRSQLSHSAP